MAISRNGDTLISGGEDKRLIFWSLKDQSKIKQINDSHNGKVCSVAEVAPGILATTSEDKSVRLWNLTNQENTHIAKFKEDEAECIQELDGNNFATGSYKNIHIWSLPDLKLLRTVAAH